MKRKAMRTVWLAAGLLVALCAAAQDPERAPVSDDGRPEVRESDLVERSLSRIAVIDVSVQGSPEAIRSLGAEHFEVQVGLRKIREFEVDRVCPMASETEVDPVEQLLAARPASYVLYFDQALLSIAGRHRSRQVARSLLPELLVDGSRVMIVSNGRELETFSGFADDTETLLAAIDRMDNDPRHFDPWASSEVQRVEEVIDALNNQRVVDLAESRARNFQKDESWRTGRALRRLETTLARLADLEAPKAVIYFADVMRQNAGEHYMSFFGGFLPQQSPVLNRMSVDALSSRTSFDAVVKQAIANGVRFYTVRAEGLVSQMQTVSVGIGGAERAGSASYSSRTRVIDADKSMGSLARESGGFAFLRGEPARRMAQQIKSDFSCLFMISFDPSRYATDSAYSLKVRVNHPGVEIRSRGQMVVQSEKTRRKSRLLAAFTAPGAARNSTAIQGGLIPTSYRKGRYKAMVQVSVPGMPLPETTWDLGASLVSDERVRSETSGRLTVGARDVPLTLEKEIEFPPGELELIYVAHETRTDLVVSGFNQHSWPNPDRGDLTAGPVVVLQPIDGIFSRDGAVRTRGSVLRSPDEPLQAELPTALVSLVCHGGRRERAEVRRTLIGESDVTFPPLEVDFGDERCAQIRDIIPSDTLGTGQFVYRVDLMDQDGIAGSSERQLTVGIESPSPAR